MVTWSTAADWDAAQDEQGVHHEQPANTDWAAADVIEKGYATTSWLSGLTLDVYIPLDEDTGSANAVVGSIDGTVTGATQGGTGVFGTTSYDFDGSDDFVRIDGVETPYITGDDWTLVFWAKFTVTPAATGDTMFLTLANSDGSTNTLQVGVGANGGVAYDEANASNEYGSGYDDGNWHCFVFTVNDTSNTNELYVDGVDLSFSDTFVVVDWDNTSIGALASDPDSGPTWGNFYDGSLDEVMFFSGVATQAQAQALYETAI